MNQNFGMPYPMYPNMMNVPPTFNSECTCNFDKADLDKRLDNLENRVAYLESVINKTTYNPTNYQML